MPTALSRPSEIHCENCGASTTANASGGSSGTVIEESIDVDALGAIDEVCLAVSTDSTSAAHFDNLTVVIPEEG